MVTYRLDQTPNVFISSRYADNKFHYVMRQFNVNQVSINTLIRHINLEQDKLFIHGTEIQESMLQKLHGYLLTKQSGGKLYVNCNGTCIIYLPEVKKYYLMVDNVTFDWSAFGVVVPNSVNDVLMKKLQHKDEELEVMSGMVSSAKDEASANKASFEALKQEAEEVKKLLATSRKDEEEMDMELQRVHGELSSKEFELITKNVEFELSKQEVKELQEQLIGSKKDDQNMENELQMMQDQLSSTCSELKSAEIMLENFEEQLCESKEECENMKMKLQVMHHQVCSAEVESQSIKVKLDSSIQRIKELESQLCSYKKKNQELEMELQNVREEVSNDYFELELMKSQLDCSYKRILELEEELLDCKMESQVKDAKIQELQDQLSLIVNDELQSMKIMMELINEKERDDDKSFDECFVTKAIEIVDE